TPPLARYVMALPLLAMDMNLPDDRSFWAREDRGEFSREFLYDLNDNSGRVVFMARLMMMLTAVFGGVFLFFWMRKKVSARAALLALFFYCLSPNILAHARLATTDITAAVFIMCSVLSFWDFLERLGKHAAKINGVFLGIALLTKFSALLLLPIYGAAYLVRLAVAVKKREKIRLLLFPALVTIALFVLWAGYGFETKPFFEDTLRVEEKKAFVENILARMGPELRDKGMALINEVNVPGSSYMIGLLGVIKHGAEGSRTFFMGKWSEDTGSPLYYLVAMAIKTPIPLILFFASGAVFALRGKYRVMTLFLLFTSFIFVLCASMSNLQLGLRYILPVYPFIFIVSAIGADSLLERKRYINAVTGLLMAWYFLSGLLIWPDYLSYFNEFIGGPANGYKYLRDSNIDWGQDLPALKKYMADNDIDTVTLNYFGSAKPEYYGITCEKIPSSAAVEPEEKVYAVSAQYLDHFEWTETNMPSAKAGYSIFIYDLRDEAKKTER
ncbi:MAG: phospholipid carrier-dependent glycosyltransferase, partial [Candidatus Omnitrophota bacterium]